MLGLTQKIRQFMLRRKGYDTLIADNVLAFYMILRDNYGGEFRREQILYAAGLMDVFAYLDRGLITPHEVARAVVLAGRGECALRGKKVVHAKRHDDDDMSDYFPDEEELLLNFIMQIECLIIAVKRRRSRVAILKIVQGRKGLLRDCVREGLLKGEGHVFYGPLTERAKAWFSSENMNTIVKGFISN